MSSFFEHRPGSLRRHRTSSAHRREQGVIITLVAVFMLFVVGAMAALSIDIVTFYTARSEAQLAADGAALAGARVLANSGTTSDTTGNSMTGTTGAWALATAVAKQVAVQNTVGGVQLMASQVTLTCIRCVQQTTDPYVTARIQVAVPTFFARIWGSTTVNVAASATAEAYNPSNSGQISTAQLPPVAPLCVKPLLFPNADPGSGTPIFTANGGINDPPPPGETWSFSTDCPNSNGCSSFPPATKGLYYPLDLTSLQAPAILPSCTGSSTFSAYQKAISACLPEPISCTASNLNIDITPYSNWDTDTVNAASCLIHDGGNDQDADSMTPAPPPFQFLSGVQNPVPGLTAGSTIEVSDSLVTVPVINVPNLGIPSNPVTVIGFLQLFLSPTGNTLSGQAPPHPTIPAAIVNMAGCGGTASAATPLIGNGSSPVAVRLISQ